MRRWTLGSLDLLATASVVVAAVGSIGSYRAFVWSTCAERVGAEGNLHSCDLSGRALENADLAKADLSNATLRDTTLSGADMSGARLTNAILERASLSGTNLDHADLSGASLGHAQLNGASLSNATGVDADFSFANLSDANISWANFSGANLSDADLSGTNLTLADLTGANLSGATLTNADLGKAIVANVDLSFADLSDTDLTGADLSGATLSGANVSKTDFTGANLDNVKLEGTKLQGAVGLSDASLSSALNVSRLDLARELSKKHLFLDTRAQITVTVGAACRGQRVPGAGTSRSNGTFVVVLTGNGKARAQGFAVGLEPTAIRYVELVVCVGPVTQETVETCRYHSTADSSLSAPSIRRYLEHRSVRLVSARTGTVIADQTFDSAWPPSCPYTTSYSQTEIHTTLYPGKVRREIASMVAAHPVR
jgi:uncharacterized protein YjbI with pentapeptide repeats